MPFEAFDLKYLKCYCAAALDRGGRRVHASGKQASKRVEAGNCGREVAQGSL